MDLQKLITLLEETKIPSLADLFSKVNEFKSIYPTVSLIQVPLYPNGYITGLYEKEYKEFMTCAFSLKENAILYDYRNTEGDIEIFDPLVAQKVKTIDLIFNIADESVQLTLEKTIGITNPKWEKLQSDDWNWEMFLTSQFLNEEEIITRKKEILDERGYIEKRFENGIKLKARKTGVSEFESYIFVPVHDRGHDNFGDVCTSIGGNIYFIEGYID